MQFAVIKARGRDIPPLVVVAGTQLMASFSWIVYFVLSGDRFVAPGAAWPAVAASAVLALVMTALLARASARGDISIVGPVFALSPIFTVLPDAVLTGAVPSALGWLGLALSVAGTASLTSGRPGERRLRTLFARGDALDALGAAILLGFLAAVDRWGALAIGPGSFLVWSHGTAGVLAAGIVAVTMPRRFVETATAANAATVVGYGVLSFVGTGMQTTALTMAPASYVNAIRRMSAVVAVLLGRALFAEPDLGRRLAGAVLACAGAACLLLAR